MYRTSVLVTAELAAALAGVIVAVVMNGSDVLATGIVLAIATVPLACAIILARRAPGRVEAPLIGLAGLVAILDTLPPGGEGPYEGTWMFLYVPFGLLLLVVPTGQFGTRRRKVLGAGLTAMSILFASTVATGRFLESRQPHYSTLVSALAVFAYVLLGIFFLLLVFCAASPFARFASSSASDRLALRWVLLAGTSVPATLLLCWASYLLLGGPDLVVIGLALMYIAIPIGTTLAIINPRRLDIDRATVDTLTAIVLSALTLAVLSFASALAGQALVAWSPSAALALTATTTAAAALSFPALRSFFENLLYPARARILRDLKDLGIRVDRGEADPEEVERVLRIAVQEPTLAIGYKPLMATSHTLRGIDGQTLTGNRASIPVQVRGEEAGAIVGYDKGEIGQAALAAVAPLVDAIRMRAELRTALAELEASRERLLMAGYAERRRLERDLHDGTQQRLVALGMMLRVLQRGSALPPEAVATLDQAVAEVGTSVAELRRIAHGLRPSSLDEGLETALASLCTAAPVDVGLDVDVLNLPDVVATTAYFVVSEALTNTFRHAQATAVEISAKQLPDGLHLSIADDGQGGARIVTGGGLAGLSDRIHALGGTLSINQPPRPGTRIEVFLPCAS